MNAKRDLQNKNQNEEDNRRKNRQRLMRNTVTYLITGLIVAWLYQQFILPPVMRIENIPYREFKAKLKAGQVVSVILGDTHIAGTMKNLASSSEKNPTLQFDTVSVRNGDPRLIEELDDARVTYSVQPPPSPLSGFLLSWVLPF